MNRRNLAALAVATTLTVMLSLTATSALAVPERTTSVVNGTPVNGSKLPRQWKGLVSIVTTGTSSWQEAHTCGGVLIDARTVLTAGHCVTSDRRVQMDPGEIEVLTGVPQPRLLGTGARNPVLRIESHPAWLDGSQTRDIAMLQLLNPEPGPYFKIPRASQASLWGGSRGRRAGRQGPFVAGWGLTRNEGTRAPNKLQTGRVDIASSRACKNPNVGGQPDANLNWERCAGIPPGGTRTPIDTCQGDSGGPLFVRRSSSRYVVGVTSWGGECGGGQYGVYTRVEKFYSWIRSNRSLAGQPLPENNLDVGRATGLTQTDQQFGSIGVAWANDGTGTAPESWYVYVAKPGGRFINRATVGGATTTATIAGLAPSKAYRVRVVGIASRLGLSDGSPTLTARTLADTQRPTRPTNLNVARRGFGRYRLRFTKSVDNFKVAKYGLYVRDGGRWVRYKTIKAKGGTSTRQENTVRVPDRYLDGRTIRVHIKAQDAAGKWSAASNVVKVRT